LFVVKTCLSLIRLSCPVNVLQAFRRNMTTALSPRQPPSGSGRFVVESPFAADILSDPGWPLAMTMTTTVYLSLQGGLHVVAEEKPFGEMVIQCLKDPQFTVRVHVGILLGGMGVKARLALPALDVGLHAKREFDDTLEMTSMACVCTTLALDRTFQLDLRQRPDLYGQPVGRLPWLSVIVL
jgi:hypothetical protein